MEFKMDKYLEVKENGFPKVIIGIRRCGRFYLLDTIYREYFNMIINVNIKVPEVCK